jgi:SAM-dependent methyltransferase
MAVTDLKSDGSTWEDNTNVEDIAHAGTPRPFVCPTCHAPLLAATAALGCLPCDRTFPIENGIVDFAADAYYDNFREGEELSSDHLVALQDELEGTRTRIERFYGPLIARRFGRAESPSPLRVLDSGCGNGISVELLTDAGMDAWGIDSSALRKWQWRQRKERRRLALGDARTLPFPDEFFDAVISSGVLEHIGVRESRNPLYRAEPEADQCQKRRGYLAELLRVVRPGGIVWVDAPNRLFPIDFWHSQDMRGSLRTHSPFERFLPTPGEIRALLASVAPTASLRFLSPRNRFRFARIGRRWYGAAVIAAGSFFFRLIANPAWSFLARSPLNPYLVAEIEKDRRDRPILIDEDDAESRRAPLEEIPRREISPTIL